MTIAIVGSGAVGLFYGAQLALAGQHVRFLLRRDYERVRRCGVRVRQVPTAEIASTARLSEFTLAPGAFAACRTPDELTQDGPPEWLLLCLKTTALDQAEALVRPALGPATGIVALCNGLGVEDRLAGWFGAERIFGALASVCINRLDDGTVDHQAHGRLLLGHQRDDAASVARLAAVMRSAGIDCLTPPCLLEARWRKLAWNVPFNGVSVARGDQGSDCARMLADPALRRETEAVMRETLAIANADLAAHGHTARIAVDDWVGEMFARTGRMGPYLTSTLLDWRAGRAIEREALFEEPARRARRHGVPTPALDAVLVAIRERTGA